MKKKSGYILHTVGDGFVILPVGERTEELLGMVKLNETAAYMWESIDEEFDEKFLSDKLIEKYSVDAETAAKAVDSFIASMSKAGLIE